ncbi:hypothetical protein A2U01_0055494, partial [Trifolium medium]|nr:hypothetical protein [Trifolium medium]
HELLNNLFLRNHHLSQQYPMLNTTTVDGSDATVVCV